MMQLAINQFPWKLHEVLRVAEETGQEAIISWFPHGKGFRVHNPKRFEAGLMKECFKQTKFKSFTRQLNLWGFQRTWFTEAEKGAYYHTYFVRGRPELCHMMSRQRIKNTPCQPSHKPMTSPHGLGGTVASSASSSSRSPSSIPITVPLHSSPQLQSQSNTQEMSQQVQNSLASSFSLGEPRITCRYHTTSSGRQSIPQAQKGKGAPANTSNHELAATTPSASSESVSTISISKSGSRQADQFCEQSDNSTRILPVLGRSTNSAATLPEELENVLTLLLIAQMSQRPPEGLP